MRNIGRIAWLLVAAGVVGTGVARAQDGGKEPEKFNALEELKKVREKMRAAEDLLAQAARDKAAVEQAEVDRILKDLLDKAEQHAGSATSRMLRGVEKAAVAVDKRIQKILDNVKFSQGKSGGKQQMEQRGQPQPKPEGGARTEEERLRQMQRDEEERKRREQQGEHQPGEQPATEAYDAKTGAGRPNARQADPNAWMVSAPAKIQEDAIRQSPEAWPGKYDDLIKRWQKTLSRLPR